MFKETFDKPLDIQYLGFIGISASCIEAVQIILQMNIEIDEVKVLTNSNEHCLLFVNRRKSAYWAVRSGFSSGYSSEGAKALSFVLWLFKEHDVYAKEYEVTEKIINKIDNALITRKDIEAISSTASMGTKRLYDYMYAYNKPKNIWSYFPPVIPYRIVDTRIMDLALTFWDDPDAKLVIGYRRLEDAVRKRIGSSKHGKELFAEAFRDEDKYKLHWKDMHNGERIAKGNLFIDVFAAYRNPRGHREMTNTIEELLEEFLLLNRLYRLEAQAVEKEDIE